MRKNEGLAAARVKMVENPATYTFDWEAYRAGVGTLYYFKLGDRRDPPYLQQRHVSAILDIAADGTLAGVEIIDDSPLPPHSPPPQAANPK